MDRKTLNEITVAALIGFLIGIAFGIVLGAEFGWEKLTTMVVSGIASALVAGACYRPREVLGVLVEISRQWQRNFATAVSSIRRGVANIKLLAVIGTVVCGIKTHGRVIGKCFYCILLLATYVIASRFTIGLFMPIARDNRAASSFARRWVGPSVIGVFFVYLSIALLLYLFEKKKLQPSWKMPIVARISNRWGGGLSDSSGIPLMCWTVKEILGWWAVSAVLAPLCLLFVLFAAMVNVIDAIATLVFALASTARLASMTGALIGTVVGLALYFHGLNHISVVIVGGMAAAFAGRWLCALRCALTYKKPTSITA